MVPHLRILRGVIMTIYWQHNYLPSEVAFSQGAPQNPMMSDPWWRFSDLHGTHFWLAFWGKYAYRHNHHAKVRP